MVTNPETVDGWLFVEEGQLLEKYAKATPDNTNILELGCYKGKSTIYLARSTHNPVVSVDTFMSDNTTRNREDTLDAFLNNTKGLSNILPIASLTSHVSKIMHAHNNLAFGLLFIDADHSYEGVKADFINFQNLVLKDGIIIFHDAYGENGEEHNTPWEGVTRFCKELMQNPAYRFVEKCRRCAVFQKVH